jgi:phosphoglycolate phosphatase
MSRRLVLFDIDGTLLSTDGAGKRAVREALTEVFGTTGPIGGYSFSGRTDPEIVHDLLGAVGIPEAEIAAGLPDVWARYLEKLRRDIPTARVEPLPGVPTLLERLGEAGGETLLGLLTGNLEEGARIKLEAAGLGFARFRVGAYGSDHRRRPELPAIAIARAHRETGIRYRGKEVVIIGDTPFDIDCGRHLGVRTVAVATGRHALDELGAHDPDHLLADLSDLEAAWAAIMD